MATRELRARAPNAPPVIEPFRRCAQDLLGDLGHAFDVIRTQADEFATREAELTARRASIETQTTELNRIRSEIDVERQQMSDRRRQLAEYLLDAPTELTAEALPAKVEKPAQAAFEAPELNISVQEPEIVPMQPEPVAAAKPAQKDTREPGPQESRFRKLRRDARRRMKGL